MQEDLAAERAAIDRVVGHRTLCDLYSRNAARHGRSPAVRWQSSGGWRELTWTAYRELVADVAMGLAGLGVGPGDAVALMLRNRPEHLVADGALLHLSAVPVPLHHGLSASQLVHAGRASAAKVAVLDGPDVLAAWDDLRQHLPTLEAVVLVDDAGDHAHLDWVVPWAVLVERGRRARAADPIAFDACWAGVRTDGPAALLYPPDAVRPTAGVLLTHRNAFWTAESVRRGLDVPAGGTTLAAGPLADAGVRLTAHWLALVTGSCTVLAGEGDVPEALRAARPTVLLAPPSALEAVVPPVRSALVLAGRSGGRAAARAVEVARRVDGLRSRGLPVPAWLRLQRTLLDRWLRSLRAGVGLDRCEVAVMLPASGATGLDRAVGDVLAAGGLTVVEAYGSAETTGMATTGRPGRWRPGTVGAPLPGVEVEVAGDSEVLVRGDNVLAGCWADPQATADAVDPAGWLRTGDAGELQEDGSLVVHGRMRGAGAHVTRS